MSNPTSPSLTMSSGSISSTSGPPATPRLGSGRYPSLGRVPLHRRGTSKQYERLEDLLREAGYKETRIFTPESDRVEKSAETNATEGTRGGVGTIVGFLAGLMQRNEGKAEDAKGGLADGLTYSNPPAAPSPRPYSPPISPLAYKRHPRPQSSESFASNSGNSDHIRRRIHQELPDSPPGSSALFEPRPSRASAYLRHMSSIPNISRPKSTPVDPQVHHNHHNTQPAPPNSFLDYVSQALIKSSDPLTRPHLRQTRSSLSQVTVKTPRGALSSARSRSGKSPMSAHLARPTQVLLSKSVPSTGEVAHTRVVCRSAPGSRAASRSRGSRDELGRSGSVHSQKGNVCDNTMWSADDSPCAQQNQNARRSAGWSLSWNRSGRASLRKKRGRAADRVPSLARTRVEGDAWSVAQLSTPADSRPPASARTQSFSPRTDRHHHHRHGEEPPDDEGSASSESDSEGELDLARILVPAKRQGSIRSLRRHLQRNIPPVPPLPAAFVNQQHLSTARGADEDDASTLHFGHTAAVWNRRAGGAEARRTLGRARGRAVFGGHLDGDAEGEREGETWGSGWVRRNGSRSGGGQDKGRSLGDGEGGDSHEPSGGRRQRLPGPWAGWGS